MSNLHAVIKNTSKQRERSIKSQQLNLNKQIAEQSTIEQLRMKRDKLKSIIEEKLNSPR